MKALKKLLYVLCFVCFCGVVLWHYFVHSDATSSDPHNSEQIPPKTMENDSIDKLLENYTSRWEKQESNAQSFRSLLGSSCDAISNALVTQDNTPLGSNISYDANKKILPVTPSLFKTFPEENPFKNAPWDSCAVVGNGGILANSSCGKQIDSASYVIRCNLPPLKNGYEKDTGSKTNFVTANPSILFRKYRSLSKKQKTFVDDMHLYGDALIMLPAFSYLQNTGVSLRAHRVLKDQSNNGPQAVFFNPKYVKSLAGFWRRQGTRSRRLSTGIMMASMALQLCNNVHLYGFWPFGTHPYTYQPLTNHYYDNRPVNKRVHAMPSEFKALLNLHNSGVIHLHLQQCTE